MGKGVARAIVNGSSTNGVGAKEFVSTVDLVQANKKRRFMNTATILTNFIERPTVKSVLEVSPTTRDPTLNSLYQ